MPCTNAPAQLDCSSAKGLSRDAQSSLHGDTVGQYDHCLFVQLPVMYASTAMRTAHSNYILAQRLLDRAD